MTQEPTPDRGDEAEPTDSELMEIVVSVDDAHMAAMPEVVSALESAGMVVDQTMTALGTVAGRVPQARLPDIGLVEGVAAIEQQRTIQLPPPDSDVQ